MTITNYTFFSPNGDDFPITANADGKLYMMLTGMNKGDFRLKHWSEPINSALNRVYVNTSLVVGGRYFELRAESVTMYSGTTNYIHAVIDLSNTSVPVTITAEKTNTSNNIDINNSTGILKVCFETVVTTTSSIASSKVMEQNTNTDILKSNKLALSGDVRTWTNIPLTGVSSATLLYKKINGVVFINGQGNWGSFTASQSKTVCTLPVELRPDLPCNYVITTQNGSGQPMELQIQTSGIVNIWSSVASGGRYGGLSEAYTTAKS